ncbi:MAG: hypothetical protein KAH01_00280 [Caldisericia bacterium]|nr:hypothetical protein [Caldisericia bacterium]
MKDKIALLRKAVDGIQDEAVKKEYTDTLSSVEQFIQTAEKDTSKTEDLQAQLEDANLKLTGALRDTMEYKSRLKKAEGHISERDEKIDKVEKQIIDFEAVKLENESLQSLKVERDIKVRSEYSELITALKERPNSDNFKDDLIFPTDETPIDKIPIEEIESSKAKIDDWKKKGFLEIGDKTKTTPSPQPDNTTVLDKTLDAVFGKG